MSWTASSIAVCSIALLHVIFMVGELWPWSSPLVMNRVLQKWPKPLDLSPDDREFVSAIVHNAGIYNGIVAAGLFAAAVAGPGASSIEVALLAGGIVAGLFGAATLTTATIAQAVLGAGALVIVIWFPG